MQEEGNDEPGSQQAAAKDAQQGEEALQLQGRHARDGVSRGATGSVAGAKADQHAVAQEMAVRRLTPVECERLQGFPDGYTNIPWRGKAESPDGPRYKALGNSWAVPVVHWIGRRIDNVLKEKNT